MGLWQMYCWHSNSFLFLIKVILLSKIMNNEKILQFNTFCLQYLKVNNYIFFGYTRYIFLQISVKTARTFLFGIKFLYLCTGRLKLMIRVQKNRLRKYTEIKIVNLKKSTHVNHFPFFIIDQLKSFSGHRFSFRHFLRFILEKNYLFNLKAVE